MPLFLDRHDLPGVTPEDLAQAHVRDLEVQGKYGVRYVTYWFDYQRQSAFCLADAPDKESAEACHREAHGIVGSRIIEVDSRTVEDFLGKIEEPAPGSPHADSAFRTVLFTDMEGSTTLTQRVGDAGAMGVLRTHDEIVREALRSAGGREVKHTGDGIMASFSSVARTGECAIGIQRGLEEHNRTGEWPIRVRIGLSAGEPVTENDDLFGATVQLAARICATAQAGTILASNAVRELSIGKGFRWADRGETNLRGFEEPVRLHELVWVH